MLILTIVRPCTRRERPSDALFVPLAGVVLRELRGARECFPTQSAVRPVRRLWSVYM